MPELSKKVGEMEYDGLISGLFPKTLVGGGTIAKLEGAGETYKRGTVLGFKSAANDGKLYIMADGGDLTPSAVLCDDIEVGTDADVTTAVYIAGCFNPAKLITKEDYALTAGDLDNLRMRGIITKAAVPVL